MNARDASTSTDAASGDLLIGRKDGAVAEIVFNNPEKRNAVSLDMWRDVDRWLTAFAEDEQVRALVVSGAGGKAFVSGADISKFESERASREAVAEYAATSAAAYEKLYHFPRPTIAKISGYCIGGGAALAACCDLRFCNESARFGIPAAKLGLGYGPAGLKRLTEIIALPYALEMFYTARQFDAAEAKAIGLVNGVLPDDALDAHVADLVARICENAPLTIATIKAAARELGKPEAARDPDALERMVQACFDSDDYVEGRRAFMEKRKPRFTGR